MREGFAADDVWMMVEDEFLDTARLFTQHLHHAEYHRLKRLAREKNASALQNISRPVVARGKMSIEAQKKHEARARAERQVEALRNIEGADNDVEELEDEAPWARDPHLGGLMSGSQDSTSQLSTIAGIKSKTRAAAGYGGTTSKLPLGKIDASKVSSAHTSKSSIAGLAKEIRRAAASSDEEDLDRYSSSSKPAKQVSVRQSSTSSAKPTDARDASMPPPKPPRPLEPNRSTLTKKSSLTTMRESRSSTDPSSVELSTKPKLTTNAASGLSTASSSKSTRRKLLTSRFTSFNTFPEPDETPQTSMKESPKSGPKKSTSPRKDPARPSLAKDKGQKEQSSISADEIPTFLI